MDKRPWWHYVLGCGCVAVIMGFLAFSVGGYFLYKAASNAFFLDPVKVDALAAELLPGAKPFPGHDGIMGINIAGFRMAVIGPPIKEGSASKGQLTVIILGLAEKIASQAEAREMMQNRNQGGDDGASTPTPGQPKRHQEKIIKQETVSLSIGGKPFEVQKALAEDENKQRLIQYLASFKKGTGSVFVLIQGTEDDFNQSLMEQFLKEIDASQLEPLPQGKGSPAQGATPEASSPTPAQSEE